MALDWAPAGPPAPVAEGVLTAPAPQFRADSQKPKPATGNRRTGSADDLLSIVFLHSPLREFRSLLYSLTILQHDNSNRRAWRTHVGGLSWPVRRRALQKG